jgi:subtilisin
VELGDLGVCFFKNGTSCAVLFGDRGPAVKLGEGSMLAAEMLGINPDPNIGGIDAGEIPPGIVHFVFPGSRRVRPVPGGRPRTDDTPESVEQRAWELFAKLGGPVRTSVGTSLTLVSPPMPAARMPAEVAASPVLSLNVRETIEHAGQAKVIVKLAEPAPNGAALSAAGGKRQQLEAELAALFIQPSEVELESLASASIEGSSRAARDGRDARAPEVYFYPRLGLAVGTVHADGAASLARHPLVKQVVKAPELSLIRPIGGRNARASSATTAWGIERLRAKELWARGFEGQGVLVGHLDTGIDGKHPALKQAIAEFAEFDMLARRVPGAEPKDSDAHGTHTAGSIAGRPVKGVVVGVAPKAKLLSGMVIEGGQVIERILAGMEWVIERRGRILSMSLGLRGFTTAFEVVVQSLRDAGVLPVVASGNENANSSRSPGNYATVLSVGACDEADRVAAFSSSQRFARPDDPLVPDIVAPGVEVLSCATGGGYRFDSGTSMATPYVAGLAALLFSAKPDATIGEVERAILHSCARPATMPQERANRGVPNAVAALERLLGRPLEGTRPHAAAAARQGRRAGARKGGNGSGTRETGKGRRVVARRPRGDEQPEA